MRNFFCVNAEDRNRHSQINFRLMTPDFFRRQISSSSLHPIYHSIRLITVTFVLFHRVMVPPKADENGNAVLIH